MKIICKDILYQEGRFEDVLGNEIRLRDGAEIKIIALDFDFLPNEVIALHPAAQLKEIQKRKFSSFTKIAERGSHLYFRLRKKEGIIQVELLEDLYLIYKSSLKTERQIFLYSCACQTGDKLNPIRSYSLTDLYKKVYIKEYGDKGANTVNAFTDFYISEDLKDSLNSEREKWKIELTKSYA